MTQENLMNKLVTDLETLGLPVNEVEISFRKYSSSYYGRYFIDSHRIFIYPYEKEDNRSFMNYDTILYHTIHEMVHHIQYSDPNFKRVYNVMHDGNFYRLFNHYSNKAENLGLLRKENVTC